jgi:hypothetical protein
VLLTLCDIQLTPDHSLHHHHQQQQQTNNKHWLDTKTGWLQKLPSSGKRRSWLPKQNNWKTSSGE